MRALAAVLPVVAACLGGPPKEGYLAPDTTIVERIILGGSTFMDAEAERTGCHVETQIVGLTADFSDEGQGLGLRRKSKVVGCRDQGIAAKAFCSPRTMCEMADDEFQGSGGASIRVRLIQPGSVKVMLEINNAETGGHHTSVRRFDVVLPQAFRTQCMTPALVWGPCAAGVSAAQPLIRVFPVLDGKLVSTALLRVNAHAGDTSTSFTTGQSLEPILGAHPIQPGPYVLDIAVGDKHEELSITVQ